MTTLDLLLKKYGPLMTLSQLATMLHRSEDGVRIATYRDDAFGQQVKAARRKIGRRIYFATAKIAPLIDGEDADVEVTP